MSLLREPHHDPIRLPLDRVVEHGLRVIVLRIAQEVRFGLERQARRLEITLDEIRIDAMQAIDHGAWIAAAGVRDVIDDDDDGAGFQRGYELAERGSRISLGPGAVFRAPM